jgi:hypothetical protein
MNAFRDNYAAPTTNILEGFSKAMGRLIYISDSKKRRKRK